MQKMCNSHTTVINRWTHMSLLSVGAAATANRKIIVVGGS